MRVFWFAFIGKAVAALFLAICAALSFGPPEWAAMILGAEPSLYARIVFGLLALGTAAAVFCPLALRQFRKFRSPVVTGKIPIAVSGLQERVSSYALFDNDRDHDAWGITLGDSSSRVTITNTSTTRSVSLDIWLYIQGEKLKNVKFLADLQGPHGLLLGKDDAVTKSLIKMGREPIEYFRCPVALEPEQTMRGCLEFLQNFDSPIRG